MRLAHLPAAVERLEPDAGGWRSEGLGGVGVQGRIWKRGRIGLVVDANLIGHQAVDGATTPAQSFGEGTIGLGLKLYPSRWLSLTVVVAGGPAAPPLRPLRHVGLHQGLRQQRLSAEQDLEQEQDVDQPAEDEADSLQTDANIAEQKYSSDQVTSHDVGSDPYREQAPRRPWLGEWQAMPFEPHTPEPDADP